MANGNVTPQRIEALRLARAIAKRQEQQRQFPQQQTQFQQEQFALTPDGRAREFVGRTPSILRRAFAPIAETPPRRAILRPTGTGTVVLDDMDKGLLGLKPRERPVQRGILDSLVTEAVKRRRASILRASKLRRAKIPR